MNPTILGVIGPGFLNQVPTLVRVSEGLRAQGLHIQGLTLNPTIC